MKPDAEHQQHDADFGQLRGDRHISHKAWCGRADDNARDQLASQHRNLESLGDETQKPRHAEASGNRRDNVDVMFHAIFWVEVSASGCAAQQRK